MATTTEYLTKLQEDLDKMRDVYQEKGIEVADNATFTDIANASTVIIKEPTESIDITENGSYDIKNYATANIDVAGGGDTDEYFYTAIEETRNNRSAILSSKVIKKIPNIIVDNKMANLDYAFHYWSNNIPFPKVLNVTNKIKTASGTFSYFNYGEEIPYAISPSATTVLDLSNWDVSGITMMNQMFYNMLGIKTINFTGWNPESVTSVFSMFSSCKQLEELDLSMFKMDKVDSLGHMFQSSPKLRKININGWDTSNVTDMSYMFNGCSALADVDFNILNTSNVTTMASMFNGVNGAASIDISSFDTRNVTDMSYMFSSCAMFEELDLSNFQTQKVTTIYSMFYGCSKAKKINLSSFTTDVLTKAGSLFIYCYKLEEIDISGMDLTKLTSFGNMFNGCGTQLPSGQKTKVYVKDEASQNWVLTQANGRPTTWDATNVIIAGSEQDTRSEN